jgi:flagellar hook-length control protein FliK
VNFTTDSPEARDALREQASAALSELLQQGGLGLGGVSVGGQGQSRDDASRGQGAGPSTVQLGQARRTGHETEGTAPARPRTDGSRPLDVFA